MNNEILVPTEAMFEDELDNINEELVIAGKVFYPSVILKKLDPELYQAAYEQFCDDYVSRQLDVRDQCQQTITKLSGNLDTQRLFFDSTISDYERNCESALLSISY